MVSLCVCLFQGVSVCVCECFSFFLCVCLCGCLLGPPFQRAPFPLALPPSLGPSIPPLDPVSLLMDVPQCRSCFPPLSPILFYLFPSCPSLLVVFESRDPPLGHLVKLRRPLEKTAVAEQTHKHLNNFSSKYLFTETPLHVFSFFTLFPFHVVTLSPKNPTS